MTQEVINVGVNADDGTGDSLREAGQKINNNFTELFAFPVVSADIKFNKTKLFLSPQMQT